MGKEINRRISKGRNRMLLPGLVWSMEGRPCSMSALAGVAVWEMGRVATHTGRGWMGGLVLRMVLAFNVAELGLRETERDKEAASEVKTAPFNRRCSGAHRSDWNLAALWLNDSVSETRR